MLRTSYGCLAALAIAAAIPAQEWFLVEPSASPGARRFHSLVFDGQRNRIVGFGGADERTGKVFGDTWELDGTTWTSRTGVGPSPRSRHAACYDTVRGRVLVFGGVDKNGKPLNDTWALDGNGWTPIATNGAPSARYSVAMSFDRGRGRAVLFGGLDANGKRLGDTWELAGSRWVQRSPSVAPNARHGHAMTFDQARGVTVLVGGFATNNRTNVETWEYDGTTWRQAKPKTTPSSMTFPALTYNPFHRVAVLVGEVGGAGTPIRTFAYDGTDWHVGPSAPRTLFGRQAPGVAFDEARDAAVLFGGASIGLRGVLPHADTWKLSTPAEFEPFGKGCATSAGVPELSAKQPPRIGASFRVELSNLPANTVAVMLLGTSNERYGALPLPFDLAPIGLPGCPLLVSIEHAQAMTANGKTAGIVFPIPLDPSQLGVTIFAQALVLGREHATSNGAKLVVGN